MEWDLGTFLIRPYRESDAQSLAEVANDREIWINLRDRFPHPYSVEDAEKWLELATGELAATNWAIEVEGKAVGGIGLTTFEDVHRLEAELGYWLGRPYWRRGIMTKAVEVVCEWTFENLDVIRIFGGIYAYNDGSKRVLEKNGFEFEGRMRKAIIKDGKIADALMFAKLKQ